MGRKEAPAILLGTPTFGTVFNAQDPTRSPINTLRVASNVKLQDGSLRSFKTPGLEDAAAAASTEPCMAYVDGKGWVYAANGQPITICHDTIAPWSGKRFSYRAAYFASVVASAGDGIDRAMGCPVPVITSVTPAAGGLRHLRVTAVPRMGSLDRGTWGLVKSDFYQNPGTGESNPSVSTGAGAPWFEVVGWDGATINIAALAGTAAGLPVFDGTELEIRVYAKPIGATTGVGKLIARQGGWTGLVATSIVINAAKEASDGTDLILSWDEGGGPETAIYKNDHSAPPFITVLSEDVHTVAPTSGGTSAIVPPSSGILVAGFGSLLMWSRVGYPWRWPIYARAKLDGEIWAIVTSQATTYIATTNSWWVLSGTDDFNMSLVRAEADHPIVPGFGKSAQMTPKGVMYLTTGGVALFNGSKSVLVHRLNHPYSASFWTGNNGNWGGYWDGYWMADLGNAAGIIVDLDDPAMPAAFLYYGVGSATASGQTIRRVHVSRVFDGVSNLKLPALWANVGTATSLPNTKPRRWDPRDDESGLNSAAEWLPWEAATQRIRPGLPHLRNKFTRYEQRTDIPSPSGMTFGAFAGNGTAITASLNSSPIPLVDGLGWLPAGFDNVSWLQFEWKDAANGAALLTQDKRVYSIVAQVKQYAAR